VNHLYPMECIGVVVWCFSQLVFLYHMASSTCKHSLTGKQLLAATDTLSDSDDFEANDSNRDLNHCPSDDGRTGQPG